MTRRIADLTCPECKASIQVPFDAKEPPTMDEITTALNQAIKDQPTADQLQKVIQEQLDKLKPPKQEDHRHKTADEFFDCPECQLWVEKTATRYQVTPKEPPKEPPQEPEQLSIGSIFGAKKEGD